MSTSSLPKGLPPPPYDYGTLNNKLNYVHLILNKGNMHHDLFILIWRIHQHDEISVVFWCVMASMIIADRCPVFLCGLISVLRSVQDFDVVASCCNPTESLQMIRDLSPDIALLDSSMPIALGINVLASAVSEGSQTRIVLLAAPEELQSIVAVASGAYGTIPRDVLPEVLIHDLRQVAAGRRLSMRASEPREARTATDTSEKALAPLTKRERQIATLVSAGLPNKEIGRQLNLTAGTIKVHLHNIYEKLLINNRTTLTALAVSDQNMRRRDHQL
jgi:two-component system, NarL family, nitrate/nitrite response regulator NarL